MYIIIICRVHNVVWDYKLLNKHMQLGKQDSLINLVTKYNPATWKVAQMRLSSMIWKMNIQLRKQIQRKKAAWGLLALKRWV
ncbi:hypothetical protein EB796_023799 [Bugula neritina]|uniref:Uncharacterized protein n=1 Tax=Bugula neritina TaxID=10212 RepID=A0A7J7IXD7_BUGNE|nr:hypothetical protein EB796_023799 [Bugula neritina]